MELRIDVYHHFPGGDDSVLAALQRIEGMLRNLPAEIQAMLDQETQDLLAAIDAETTAVGDRIEALVEQLSTAPTPADVAALKSSLTAEVSKLKGLAADQTNPVPEPTTEPGTVFTAGRAKKGK